MNVRRPLPIVAPSDELDTIGSDVGERQRKIREA